MEDLKYVGMLLIKKYMEVDVRYLYKWSQNKAAS